MIDTHENYDIVLQEFFRWMDRMGIKAVELYSMTEQKAWDLVETGTAIVVKNNSREIYSRDNQTKIYHKGVTLKDNGAIEWGDSREED